MIEIACKKNKFTYNVYHITKAFFPGEEIMQRVDEKQESLVELKLPGGSCFSLAPEEISGELQDGSGAGTGARDEALFRAAEEHAYRSETNKAADADAGRREKTGGNHRVPPKGILCRSCESRTGI